MAETLTLIEKTVCMKSTEVFGAIPTEPLAQLAARANEAARRSRRDRISRRR